MLLLTVSLNLTFKWDETVVDLFLLYIRGICCDIIMIWCKWPCLNHWFNWELNSSISLPNTLTCFPFLSFWGLIFLPVFQKVELQSLWQNQPVVVFFLRRFGCQVCRWMASEISKLEPDLRANGVSLAGVGPEELGLQEFKEGGFFKGCKHHLFTSCKYGPKWSN